MTASDETQQAAAQVKEASTELSRHAEMLTGEVSQFISEANKLI
jgi:hypothetical protein